jgi:hypothetical protein
MRNSVTARALAVMKRLIALDKIIGGVSVGSNKSERDFRAVEADLVNGRYSSILDWMDAVECVIRARENAFAKSSEEFYFLVFTRHVRRVFNKSCAHHFLFTMETWCDYVHRLREREARQMLKSPSLIQPWVKSAIPSAKKVVQADSQQVPISQKLNSLVAASELLTGEQEQADLIEIIRKLENLPDANKAEVSVDLTRLKPSTLDQLEECIRRSLQARGIPYPE